MKLFAIVEKYPIIPRDASSEYCFTLVPSLLSLGVRHERYESVGDLEEAIQRHRANGADVITSSRPFRLKRFYTKRYGTGEWPSAVTVIRIPLDEYKRTQESFKRERTNICR